MATKSPQLRTVHGSALAAVIDAGKTIITAGPERIITVVDAWVRSTGTADTCTSVDITDGTTVFVAFGVAGLTNGTVLRAGAANTTITNLLTDAVKATDVQIKTAGSGIGTATAIEYYVEYTVSSAAHS
jgi:hypothetical protein